jgi:hypothetical protein
MKVENLKHPFILLAILFLVKNLKTRFCFTTNFFFQKTENFQQKIFYFIFLQKGENLPQKNKIIIINYTYIFKITTWHLGTYYPSRNK